MNAPPPDTIVQPWNPRTAAHLAHVRAATAWRGNLEPKQPRAAFAVHTARRAGAERAARWRDRLAAAGIAAALLCALGAAVVLADATAGPIRPHVAAKVEARP